LARQDKDSTMSAPRSIRRRASVVFTGLFVPAATFLLMPGAAVAALSAHAAAPATAPSTVQASIGAGGSVKSAILIANNGAISSYAGQIPLAMTISSTVSGASRTTNYHIENTSGQQQKVTWRLPNGQLKSTTVNVQLPLVGHLIVALPRTDKNVQAPGAAVTTNSDGSHTLDWSLVMFSPLGNPVQDLAFTATGPGAPDATLHASLISPTSAPGLSASAQDANQSVAQTGTWSAEAAGADKGLSQLNSGVGALVTGLEQLATGASQLHDGLAPALTGAQQLDAGSHQALSGAQRLAGGLSTIHAGQRSLTNGLSTIHQGQASLTQGLSTIHAGQRSLTGGLSTIHRGQQSLTGGLGDIHTGQQSLTGGLGKIRSGQDSLTGGLGKLQVGQVGLTGGLGKLQAGQDKLSTGLGGLQAGQDKLTTKLNDLKNGIDGLATGLGALRAGQDKLSGGLSQLQTGADQLAGTGGIPLAIGGVKNLESQVDAIASALSSTDPATAAKLQGIASGLDGVVQGLTTAEVGAAALRDGIGFSLDGSQTLSKNTQDAINFAQLLSGGTSLLTRIRE